ncbi:MAG TPA: alkaline phosphatase D family protein [Kofleriaceae bacterium]|nr:alkaline phosphatase D family protein [Kofleriaceae bacterium]
MLSRRKFVFGALSASAAVACGPRALRLTRQPAVTHGVQAGDVQVGRAVVWARCDEAARMEVQWATTPRFATPTVVAGPVVTAATDFTGTVALAGLPAGQTVFYRIRFVRVAERGGSAWAIGQFMTPPTAGQPVRFAWSGDTCGQGFGINDEWGGLKSYAALAAVQPQFFLHSGDLMYADNPILPEKKLDNGRIWRNRSNPGVAKVAETIEEFRARFAYNFDDEHVRNLAAHVPILAQWDDHETHNNWWPGQLLDDDRYVVRDASVLAARARQATFEWTPIGRNADPSGADATIHRVIHYGPLLDVIVVDLRSWRTPNDDNRGSTGAMMGAAQTRWFIDAVASSRATWKVIACDQPLALVIGDGPGDARQEGFANGALVAGATAAPPAGRELELAGVLRELKQRNVKNVVWLTADVHYAAAHHFDPARAAVADFDPFWEFVAGPLHAGTFGPNSLDPTFGPEVRFIRAPAPGTGNLAPWDGMQSFGTVELDGRGAGATVRLHDGSGRELYRVELPRQG